MLTLLAGMGAAAYKLFHTTELLEAILLKTNTRALLTTHQRVCKQWRDVIQGSINLKKALFLETGQASIAYPGPSGIESAIIHGLYVSTTGLYSTADERRLARIPKNLESCPVQFNPFLSPKSNETIPLPKRFLRAPMFLCHLNPQLLLAHESASCRRMYITQPPVKLQIFDVVCSVCAMKPRHLRPFPEPRSFRKVRTFGELIDAVKEKLEGKERLKIVKCLRIMVGVGPEEVKDWVEEYGSKLLECDSRDWRNALASDYLSLHRWKRDYSTATSSCHCANSLPTFLERVVHVKAWHVQETPTSDPKSLLNSSTAPHCLTPLVFRSHNWYTSCCSPTAEMAAARVFAIPELVEAILLRLPTKDLLLSKRISRICRDAHESKSIKKALFLVPGTALNTSDEASFPQPGYSASIKYVKSWWSSSSYEVPLPEAAKHGVSFNPLLVAYFTGQTLTIQSDRMKASNTAELRVLCHGDDASFRRMFITQPPLRMMTVHANYRYAHGNFSVRMIGGMTYGELLDEMEMFLKEGQKNGQNEEHLFKWGVGVRSEPKGQDLEDASEALTFNVTGDGATRRISVFRSVISPSTSILQHDANISPQAYTHTLSPNKVGTYSDRGGPSRPGRVVPSSANP
ncbi:uncharacterized protein MYCFIDRAFT_170130 [Pseudocercospora fijiensis CIRAD86]|uniref:F-box domain-containing protein n=1 Tax=Pseudocercospora fijiensis (strain CIRAD86) TaxID=383855 RepID=N1QBJ1_PSEFD|nr:uncharacterized protein MYCFIDRAFT_170130 [Pseudocercospora fijiensis CIRAD86]EME88523.1 hypothetical protein MYCFIDRAFT_170130 [Pseudocercospora fijiensis CIRAD86]